MTQECYETHLLYLQCKFADLIDQYTNKLSIGANCIEIEKDVSILKSLIKILNKYDYTEECNCITEKEFCKIFNYADSILCKYNCKC